MLLFALISLLKQELHMFNFKTNSMITFECICEQMHEEEWVSSKKVPTKSDHLLRQRQLLRKST
ncbi:hypothetical protein VCR20J5_710071 [Vibrio crassostreae]|nr:hypothetical protein VCR20J5_710071 [Vibrio crassostreae]